MNEQKPGQRIRFDDIRPRDHVERKHKGVTASITVSERTDTHVLSPQGGTLDNEPGASWKLLERKEIALPAVPTWGWITHVDTRVPTFGRWVSGSPFTTAEGVSDKACGNGFITVDEIADFMPVSLIPTQLVDDLRDLHTKAVNTERAADGPLSMFVNIAGRFLDYVDRTTIKETQ